MKRHRFNIGMIGNVATMIVEARRRRTVEQIE